MGKILAVEDDHRVVNFFDKDALAAQAQLSSYVKYVWDSIQQRSEDALNASGGKPLTKEQLAGVYLRPDTVWTAAPSPCRVHWGLRSSEFRSYVVPTQEELDWHNPLRLEKAIRAHKARGGHIDDIGVNGMSALQTACYLGKNLHVFELLRQGADPNQEHGFRLGECTPLWITAHGASDQMKPTGKTSPEFGLIMQMLRMFGANPDYRVKAKLNSWCTTPLSKVKILALNMALADDIYAIPGANVNFCPEGNTHLMHAMLRKDDRVAQFLVNKGADVNKPMTQWAVLCPLGVAAMDGNTRMVEYFLDHGADPNLKSHVGRTVLMNACFGKSYRQCGSTEIIQLLLDAGANVNAESKIIGETALHFALMSDGSLSSDPKQEGVLIFNEDLGNKARLARVSLLLRAGAKRTARINGKVRMPNGQVLETPTPFMLANAREWKEEDGI